MAKAVVSFIVVFVFAFFLGGWFLMPYLPPVPDRPVTIVETEYWTTNWAGALLGLILGVLAELFFAYVDRFSFLSCLLSPVGLVFGLGLPILVGAMAAAFSRSITAALIFMTGIWRGLKLLRPLFLAASDPFRAPWPGESCSAFLRGLVLGTFLPNGRMCSRSFC